MTHRIRRLSRRTLLTDFGAAGVGIIILGACGGSSSSSNSSGPSTSTTAAATTENGAAPSTDPATDPSDESVSTEGEPAATDLSTDRSTGGVAGELQYEWVSLDFVSAYVLMRGNEAAVVDTGTSGSRDAILAGLDAFSLGPSAVKHIVLTHNHGDHAGGLAGLEGDLTNATVYAGPGDIDTIATGLTLTQLGDGDEVFGMGVIGTPGHTPGSISLFDTGTGLLIAGDAINGDGSGGLTGANPSFTPDLDTAALSVAKLAALMPQIAAFGHGGAPVTDDVAAQLAAVAAT